MDHDLLFALGKANEGNVHTPSRITRFSGSVKLALTTINKHDIWLAPSFDMFILKPPVNRLVHVIEVVIVILPGLKLAVVAFAAHAIAKYHHAGYHIGALHVADIVAFDTPWEIL